MNSELSRQDQQLVDRFLDGALAAQEQAGVRQRLQDEPALRAFLQERQQLRRGFASGRGAVVTPPAGFAEGVLAAARRLPPVGVETAAATAVLCRRILLAAAAVVIAAVLWQSGLFRAASDGTLHAAPDEAQRVIDDLDARIQVGGGERK